MLSKNITNSAKFLKMPAETQALYFHLCISADDDWVVEAFAVMRLLWATEDSIKILHAKWFVKILNEDLVTYILDRNEHNLLRADRKIDSIYKELLLQLIPNIQLVEPKQRADRKRDVNGTSQGQPMDGLGEDSIGKFRKGEDSVSKDISTIVDTTTVVVADSEIEVPVLENWEREKWSPPAPPYWNEEVNNIIEIMKQSCNDVWLQYMPWYKEREFAKHILSKKLAKEIEKYWYPLEVFIREVIKASKQPYMKKVNTPKDFYDNRWHVINASKQKKSMTTNIFTI